MVKLVVKLKLKVGPKGQIVIPKIFREKYGIKENSYITVEARENELIIRRAESIDEALEWLKERRKRLGRRAKLGELAEVDLEEEFEDENSGGR